MAFPYKVLSTSDFYVQIISLSYKKIFGHQRRQRRESASLLETWNDKGKWTTVKEENMQSGEHSEVYWHPEKKEEGKTLVWDDIIQ